MKKMKSDGSKVVKYRREPGSPLTAKQMKSIEELVHMWRRKIDTSDIPELPLAAWKDAVRGSFIVR